MNRNFSFCEECRDDTEYTVSEALMTGTLMGTDYSYKGKEAHCVRCGSLVYISEINDENLKSLYDVYRVEHDIISLEDIQTIPKKYAIGKRPLSLLLGWGELTFSRYYSGSMPTKQYSDILKKILSDPLYFSELLEVGKGKLTAAAYSKSKNTLNELLDPTYIEASAIYTAVEYLLFKCEDITPLALQKALYYIQGFYFAFFKEYLFAEDCEAWVHGPVYRGIYNRYRNYCFDPISHTESFDEACLTAREKAVFDSVIDYLCCYSGRVLERFTHSEAPWLNARGDLPLWEPSERIIAREAIGEYFSAVKEKYSMVNPKDIQGYGVDMFRRV